MEGAQRSPAARVRKVQRGVEERFEVREFESLNARAYAAPQLRSGEVRVMGVYGETTHPFPQREYEIDAQRI